MARKKLVIEKSQEKTRRLFHLTIANNDFIEEVAKEKRLTKSDVLNSIIEYARLHYATKYNN